MTESIQLLAGFAVIRLKLRYYPVPMLPFLSVNCSNCSLGCNGSEYKGIKYDVGFEELETHGHGFVSMSCPSQMHV